MAFEMRNIPVFIRFTVIGAVVAAPLAFSINGVHAQVAENDRPYTPSGHMFDANRDGSKVFSGSRSEVETRADIYESENYRRELEAQTRVEHLRRFSDHNFNRNSGPYDDY